MYCLVANSCIQNSLRFSIFLLRNGRFRSCGLRLHHHLLYSSQYSVSNLSTDLKYMHFSLMKKEEAIRLYQTTGRDSEGEKMWVFLEAI